MCTFVEELQKNTKTMKYKILALDIDGTTINSQKEITPRTLTTLRKVQEMGIKLVLATGRPTYGMQFIADELQLAKYGGYILSYNGGEITQANNNRVVFQQTLPTELLPTLYHAAKDAGVEISTYDKEYVISENIHNPYVQHEVNLIRMKALQVENFVAAATKARPIKCLIVGEPEKIIPVGETLNQKYSSEISAFRSEDFYLEVVPKGIDKALSLQKLLTELNLSPSEMIAMGDGHNDLTMIELAGLGIAMGNAKTELKAIADHITLTNDQDGVATAIEKFILQNPNT